MTNYINFVLVRAVDGSVRLYQAKPWCGIKKDALVEVDTPRGRQIGYVIAECTEAEGSDTADLIRAIAVLEPDKPLRKVLAVMHRDVINYDEEKKDAEETDTASSDS